MSSPAAVAPLRAIVCVKRVVDYTLALRLRKDGLGIDTSPSVKHVLNPFDETALEAALMLRERKIVSSVSAVSVGAKDSLDVLRTALAMGADDATLLEGLPGTTEVTCSHVASRAIAAHVRKLLLPTPSGGAATPQPLLLLLGKQSVDSDMGTVGAYLGALLGWPTVSAVTQLNIKTDAKTAASGSGTMLTASRLRDVGEDKVQCLLPAVVTTDLRLNTPRFVTLPGIMKAKKRQIPTILVSELLGADAAEKNLKVTRVSLPPPRPPGIMVKSVDELIDKLRNTSKVI